MTWVVTFVRWLAGSEVDSDFCVMVSLQCCDEVDGNVRVIVTLLVVFKH